MKDDKMTDEALSKLNSLHVPAPSPEAKKLALNAALVAFDAVQVAPRKVDGGANKWGWFTSRWSFGAGIAGLGTVAAALVLLPLGTQLYSTTSHGPLEPALKTRTATSAAPTSDAASIAGGQTETDLANRRVTTIGIRPDGTVVASNAANALGVEKPKAAAQNTPAPVAAVAPMADAQPPSLAAMRAPASPEAESDTAADALATVAPMPISASRTALGLQNTQPSGDTFQKFDENRVTVTAEQPVSTFSIDVDTASYSYVRGLLEAGSLPQPDAVRLEEMINYFPYDYPAPTSLDTPFKATMTVFPTPWNKATELLEIGIKGYIPPPAKRAPESLTFLIDSSGSMDEPNKLPLLKRTFGLLVDHLQPDDQVAIVTYAGAAGEVLPPTRASDKATILSALDNIGAGGSTAGAEGIALAYQVAEQAAIKGGVNRVILATDGDFNVGIDTPDALKTFIAGKRDTGISLSVLGFGRGNLDDALMQALAQNGNGNASYIDDFREAQKVMVDEAVSNFITIAKDVKVQVEFNPAQVSEYRLIGYETRALNREDFNNDAVDAGEIGAGHTVTALYEITPAGTGGAVDPLRYAASASPGPVSDELGFLKLRYKSPDGDVSRLVTAPITRDLAVGDVSKAGDDQRFAAAVAAFGQKLKGSVYGAGMSWAQIADLANGAKGADPDGYRAEFVQLVKLAGTMDPDHPGMTDGPASDAAPDGPEASAPSPSIN